MALSKNRRSEIPTDAVILSEEEAIEYQLKIMKAWKNKKDTFGVRYGSTILGTLTALAGIYINNHYRWKLKLSRYGQFASYLPICVVPSVLSILLHSEFVLTNVILQKSCVVCIELRSSAIQAMTGCVFPAILAPISAISLAMKYNTYDVPYITEEPKKVFQLWQKLTKPVGNTLFAIFLCQALAAAIVTYLESKSILTVNAKLAENEHYLENHGSLP